MKKLALGILMLFSLFLIAGCQQQSVIEGVVEDVGTNSFCAKNPKIDLNIRIQDTLQSSLTYQPATIYMKNLDTGSIITHSVSASSTFTSITGNMTCTNPKGYKLWIQTGQDGINGGEPYTITPDMLKQNPVEVTMYGTNHTKIKVKAYDDDEKANLYIHNSSYTDDNTTSFYSFTSTNIALNVSTAAAGTAKTVGTDGFLDYEFTLSPVTANEQAGEGAYLAVNIADDSNVDDWEADTLEITFDGMALSEATGISSNDIVALNAYEKIYKLPYAVGTDANGNLKTQHKLTFYLQSQSGVNPDFSPVIRYVEIGDYQSQKDASDVQEGIAFRDDSSRTAVGSASVQTLTIKVA